MPGHHNYTKSQNIEALSIFNQKNLQKRGEKPDRRHLLGLLCSYTRQQISVRNEEVEQQLCCFDRMKKLICSQDIEAADAEQNQINSIMIEQKINQMQAKMNKTLKKENSIKTHKRISSSHNFSRRSCIIEDLKKGCMQKYVNHQVLKRDKQIGQVRKVIEKQVHSKVNQIVEDRGLQFLKLKEDYEALKKQMLAKNLEIEGLKSKQNQMKQYITDLQQRTKCHKETKRDTQPKQQGQSFQQRFRQTFGEYTIEQLKARLEVSIGKCLDGFERVQNKNQIKLQDQRKVYQQKQARMKARINQLQFSENQLMSNLKNLKINKNISEIEFDNLLKAKLQLQNLQKWILSLFTEWHQQRSQSEKKVLNIIGCLDQNYSYEQMLKYIVEYGKKYSSHDKLNDYLFKVLRGIQKLRRIIWPQLCNEKLDPLATIESLQKWIKLRVSVPQYNKKIGTARQSNYLANEQLS